MRKQILDLMKTLEQKSVSDGQGIVTFQYDNSNPFFIKPTEFTVYNFCTHKTQKWNYKKFAVDLEDTLNELKVRECFVIGKFQARFLQRYLPGVKIQRLSSTFRNTKRCEKCRKFSCSVQKSKYIAEHYFKSSAAIKCLK